MNKGDKRFRIKFGGRNYPSWRPLSVTIFAVDSAVAKAWAMSQMDAWGIRDPAKVKIEISEEPSPKGGKK